MKVMKGVGIVTLATLAPRATIVHIVTLVNCANLAKIVTLVTHATIVHRATIVPLATVAALYTVVTVAKIVKIKKTNKKQKKTKTWKTKLKDLTIRIGRLLQMNYSKLQKRTKKLHTPQFIKTAIFQKASIVGDILEKHIIIAFKCTLTTNKQKTTIKKKQICLN